MGKIRIKTLGNEEQEQKEQKKKKQKQEAKKLGKAPGLKGGQRINVVGPTGEELANVELTPSVIANEAKQSSSDQEITPSSSTSRNDKKAKTKKSKARARSKRYQTAKAQVDRTKKYSLQEAIELLPKVHLAKFDETVELHINTIENLSGSATFPHGTGKKTRVAIATEALLKEIEQGKIDFDVLLAEPQMMAKLAKVARILGPKGLMPNPKNGTVIQNPQQAAKKYEGGLFTFKTESKAPVLHVSVGKLSFGDKKLTENIQTIFTAVKKEKIKSAVLKSTMSPGIKVDVVTA